MLTLRKETTLYLRALLHTSVRNVISTWLCIYVLVISHYSSYFPDREMKARGHMAKKW